MIFSTKAILTAIASAAAVAPVLGGRCTFEFTEYEGSGCQDGKAYNQTIQYLYGCVNTGGRALGSVHVRAMGPDENNCLCGNRLQFFRQDSGEACLTNEYSGVHFHAEVCADIPDVTNLMRMTSEGRDC